MRSDRLTLSDTRATRLEPGFGPGLPRRFFFPDFLPSMAAFTLLTSAGVSVIPFFFSSLTISVGPALGLFLR